VNGNFTATKTNRQWYLSVSEHIDSTNSKLSHVKRTTTTPAVDISKTRDTPHRAGEHRCNWTRPRQRLVSPDCTVLNVLTPHSSSPTRRTKAHVSWRSKEVIYHCARCLLRPCPGNSKRPNSPSLGKLTVTVLSRRILRVPLIYIYLRLITRNVGEVA